MAAGNTKEIALGEGFGDVAVKVNGATIEVSAAGNVLVKTKGNVVAVAGGAVFEEHFFACESTHQPAIAAEGPKAEPKPGDKMSDGTIYAGISPDTHQPMYTTPEDAPMTCTFNEAAAYANQLNAERHLGHDDWSVPTKAELNVLWKNRDEGALKETFNNVSASDPAGWYWSSTQKGNDDAWTQRFSDGNQYWDVKTLVSSLRCLRG